MAPGAKMAPAEKMAPGSQGRAADINSATADQLDALPGIGRLIPPRSSRTSLQGQGRFGDKGHRPAETMTASRTRSSPSRRASFFSANTAVILRCSPPSAEPRRIGHKRAGPILRDTRRASARLFRMTAELWRGAREKLNPFVTSPASASLCSSVAGLQMIALGPAASA